MEARRRGPSARLYYWGTVDRLASVAAAVSGFITDGVFTAGVPRDGEDKAPEVLDDIEGVRRLAALVEIRSKYKFPFVVIERVPNGQSRAGPGHGPHPGRTGVRSLGGGGRPQPGRGPEGMGAPPDPGAVRRRGRARPARDHRPPAGRGARSSIWATCATTTTSEQHPARRATRGRYAGIVSWFRDDEMAQPRAYEGWLLEQLHSGMRVAILGRPGFVPSSALLSRMGVVESTRRVAPPVIIATPASMVGFEARPTPLARDLPTWQSRRARFTSSCATARCAAAAGGDRHAGGAWPWTPIWSTRRRGGGCAGSSNPSRSSAGRWTWSRIPAPDFTTENGRRLLFIHIDGDSFASKAEMPGKHFSGQVIMREFLDRYPFPTPSRSSRARRPPRACTRSYPASWSRSPSRSSGCPTSRWPATRSATRSTGSPPPRAEDGRELQGSRAHAGAGLQVLGRA